MSGLRTSWYDEGKEITRFELSLNLGRSSKTRSSSRWITTMHIQRANHRADDRRLHRLLKLMTANPEKNLAARCLTGRRWRRSQISKSKSQKAQRQKSHD